MTNRNNSNIYSYLQKTMAFNLSDNPTIHQLTSLKEELTLLCSRQPTELSLYTRKDQDSLILQANNKLQNENDLILNLVQNFSQLLSLWINSKQNDESRIDSLDKQLQCQIVINEQLVEDISFQTRKIRTLEEEIERLGHELAVAIERAEHSQAGIAKMNPQMLKLQAEIVELSQKQKQMISTIINQKGILVDQVRHERRINTELKEEFSFALEKAEAAERQLKEALFNIQELQNEYRILQTVLQEKQQHLKMFQSQLRTTKTVDYFTPFESYINAFDETLPESPQRENINNKSIKLDEDISYIQPHINQIVYIRLIDTQDIRSPAPALTLQQKMSMDPYFAHYILTSQSVKIREEDCEELLGIDAKPYYQEIVEKKVPMHLWDQWIRNKLREILKQRRLEQGEDSDQDY